MSTQDGLDKLGKFLMLPPSLRDGGAQRLYGWLVYGIVALFVGIVAWSVLAQMRELAIAPGEIVSASFVQGVHHLEGGIIDKMYVAEGDKVTPGTPLLRLKPELAEADFQQLLSRQALLRLRQIDLNATINGKEPVFGDLATNYPDLTTDQMALHRQTLSAWQSERQQLLFGIQQAEGALAAGRAQLESAKI